MPTAVCCRVTAWGHGSDLFSTPGLATLLQAIEGNMALMAIFSLFCYMTTLAVALTIYGANLMNLRWFALFSAVITGGLYWISSRQYKLYRWKINDNTVLLAYLIVTFLSVIAAENPLFSGLKWVSHALMIVTLLVLLKNSLTVGQAAGILLFLKVVISALLLVSWLNPLSPTVVKTSQLYQGAFGSSNALGQVAAVGAVSYLHGFLTDRAKWLRNGQIGMLGLAVWLMWATGSRSALVAFLTGLALMYYFYPKLIRGRMLWITLLVASLMIAFPWLPGKIQQVVFRSDKPMHNVSDQLLITRKSVWEASWAGFQKRPLLGWGFGADAGISKKWEVEFTALGTVTRDAVNDTLLVLESSGVVGLGAYVLLVIFAVRQIPTRRERHLLGRIHSRRSSLRGVDLATYHLHAIAFVVAASLLLMVQFDNTALSAGNFVSVTLWLCVALAGVVRTKTMADEMLYQRNKQLSQRRAGARIDTPWVPSEHVRR
jgi:O-antigen ligase